MRFSLSHNVCLRFSSFFRFEAQHLLHSLHQANFKKWVSLSEGAAQTLGWLTTNGRKESMALLLRECLRVGKIAYSDWFFSLSMSKQEAKKRMGDETRNFSVITEPGKTAFAKVSIFDTEPIFCCKSCFLLRSADTSNLTLDSLFSAVSKDLHWQARRATGRHHHSFTASTNRSTYVLRRRTVFEL